MEISVINGCRNACRDNYSLIKSTWTWSSFRTDRATFNMRSNLKAGIPFTAITSYCTCATTESRSWIFSFSVNSWREKNVQFESVWTYLYFSRVYNLKKRFMIDYSEWNKNWEWRAAISTVLYSSPFADYSTWAVREVSVKNGYIASRTWLQSSSAWRCLNMIRCCTKTRRRWVNRANNTEDK